jgi:hypothetical protein
MPTRTSLAPSKDGLTDRETRGDGEPRAMALCPVSYEPPSRRTARRLDRSRSRSPARRRDRGDVAAARGSRPRRVAVCRRRRRSTPDSDRAGLQGIGKSRCSRRTTSAIGGSRCINRDGRWRGSAGSSGQRTISVTADTYTARPQPRPRGRLQRAARGLNVLARSSPRCVPGGAKSATSRGVRSLLGRPAQILESAVSASASLIKRRPWGKSGATCGGAGSSSAPTFKSYSASAI